jgi:hypothetical protein
VAALSGSCLEYEAYAEYELGAALVGLRRCDEAIQHLNRSERLQGAREPITRARRACQGGDDDD